MSTKLTPRNLSKIVDASYRKFDHMRKARIRFLGQYIGRFYSHHKTGDDDERKATPLNFINQAVSTILPNLVYRDPKFKVRTDVMEYRGYADMLELATNTLVTKLKFRNQLRMAILDSLFYAGFIKTGIAETGDYIQFGDQNIPLGEPFADRVDPDDMILDPMAKHWDAQMYIGNRFRVLRQDLLDSGTFDPDIVNSLPAHNTYVERRVASDISGSAYDDLHEVLDYVDLAEVYIPRDKRVVTIPWHMGYRAEVFLRDVDFSGPDSGPFHMLGYAPVPDNVLPLPPVSLWYDLHVLGNRMARKIARQADRIKRVLAYDGTAVEDAQAIKESDDGEAVRVQNIAALKEVNFGGTSEDAYSFMQWAENQFSKAANSLDQLSGAKAAAPTATQSEMLQQNSSIRLADMQNQVYDFAAGVGTDLAFFLHTDPLIELPLVRRVKGQDQQVVYTPEMRRGDFMCYMLRVEPMSMAKPDPNKKTQLMMQFASNVIPAAAQAAQILGPAFKLGPFLERMASEIGLEEVDEFIDMPSFHRWMATQLAAKVSAGKAGEYVTSPQDPSIPIHIGQPNPGQMASSPQNLTPTTEQATQAQQAAAQLQAAYPKLSAGAQAAAINLRSGQPTPGGP